MINDTHFNVNYLLNVCIFTKSQLHEKNPHESIVVCILYEKRNKSKNVLSSEERGEMVRNKEPFFIYLISAMYTQRERG